ncbi:molecular chaperone DnaJ [Desulfurivibrio sp. D14AmB]|uniref:J domain-containing protein n=1 Tax=Desulfurivibrio sp. D14AmB TaxID=3374370 RepID=UPI00376F3C54
MSLMVAEQDLYRACEVIFGSKLDLSSDFLQYLQLSGVKSAYRQRALETHPDRFLAQADADEQQRSGLLFHDVQRAYENLVNYLQAREQGLILPSPRRAGNGSRRPHPKAYSPNGAGGRRTKTGFKAGEEQRGKKQQPKESAFGGCFWNLGELYQGPLPNRRLLLGHFLYYSGITSWRTIVQALIWQRSNRPKIGEISRRFGLLDDAAIEMVLKSRQGLQPFGQSALKLGLLDESQLRLLIQVQQRMQRKFGEYFVEHGLLQPRQLARLLQEYHEHNNRLARAFAGHRP